MVAGDMVNTASRLQSVAPPRTVLVGEATQRAAGDAIVFEPAGEQVLKGKASPVPAWRAVRVVAQRGGVGRTETLEAPFVGRDEELRQLKDLFHATTREGRPRLVSVIGPAGIGKSRLAWEFLKYIDGLVETVWWHEGRSPAYGDGITFWALGEMVRGRAGLQETDDEATTRAAIAAMLEEHVPDAAERRWIEPALLSLLGLEPARARSSCSAPGGRSSSGSRRRPRSCMVFEDFHYADTGLLDFVDHLMEWSRDVPILIVTLARPELLERRPDWGAGKRSFTSIHLEPLSTEAMRELLAGLVPGLPAAARDAIVARADGIPLYAVETVRMLLAQGRLVLEDGVYRPAGDLTDLAVPETLTALISARLDELDAADRALVADAAVLGQSFTPAALAAVVGRGRGDLEPRLRAWSGGSCSSRGRSPLARARPVRLRPGAHPRGRLQHARQARPQGRATSPRPATSRRSGPTSWPGRWPATTSRPSATPRRARGGRAGGPGADRASRRGRAGGSARRARAGDRVPRARARRQPGPGRPGGPPRAGARLSAMQGLSAEVAERHALGGRRGSARTRRSPGDRLGDGELRLAIAFFGTDGARVLGVVRAGLGGVLGPRGDSGRRRADAPDGDRSQLPPGQRHRPRLARAGTADRRASRPARGHGHRTGPIGGHACTGSIGSARA